MEVKPTLSEEDVLRLQVTVDDLVLLEQVQRAQELLGKATNQLEREATESVGLDELVEIHVEELCRYAKMSAEVEAVGEVDHAMFVFGVLDIWSATSPLVKICRHNLPSHEAFAGC